MLNKTDVILTGAGGWLGSAIARALLIGLPDCSGFVLPKEARLRCLVLRAEDAKVLPKGDDRLQVIVGDLRNPADAQRLFEGVSNPLVIHTAGIIHPEKVKDFYSVNVEGTKNLVTAAQDVGATRIVAVSSNSPCGCNPNREHRFNEDSPYNPYMNYGRSKMQMEQFILSQNGATEHVIVRCPWFYGPLQPPRQTVFFQMIRDGKGPIVGDGGNLRSMSYIDNLCQGILLAATVPGINKRVYWIADERAYSMNEIIDTIEDVLEKDFGITCAHRRMKLPGIAGQIAQVCDATLQSLGLYHQKIHVLSEMNKNIACDVSRAKAELNYRPTVSLREGMRRSISWVLENGLWPDARPSTPQQSKTANAA